MTTEQTVEKVVAAINFVGTLETKKIVKALVFLETLSPEYEVTHTQTTQVKKRTCEVCGTNLPKKWGTTRKTCSATCKTVRLNAYQAWYAKGNHGTHGNRKVYVYGQA